MTISTVLLDIEGTTTPIDFVYKTLFPYARARSEEFIARHHADEEVRAIVSELFGERAKEESPDAPPLGRAGDSVEEQTEAVAAYLRWLMDRDRKVTPLKTLQGLIWEEGYESGELKGEVFPDVAPNLMRWRGEGKAVCIYSSGSVLAQRLLFAHTERGDLTEFIQDFFDTNVGHKTEPESYTKIADALGRRPPETLFISDVTAELDAARAAGFQTLLCVRPGNHARPSPSVHETIHTFDEADASHLQPSQAKSHGEH
jgi:enolase-phosphatase E1